MDRTLNVISTYPVTLQRSLLNRSKYKSHGGAYYVILHLFYIVTKSKVKDA